MKQFWVYIMASKPYGVLYIGVTSDLIKRIYQHKHSEAEGFTKEYHVKRLVYFEEHADAESAIIREKRLKKWYRSMKIDLIEQKNPHWDDLYPSLAGTETTDKIPAFAGMTK
jgi:putative endonuclease